MNELNLELNKYKKKITDLEYDKSLLLQRNKLLEKELESLTNKYNALKNELLDIEQHINFCKENQLQIIDLSQKDQINQKEINIENFSSFKRKIKTLLEYDNNFMEMNSDTTLLNMIIDYIQTIKKENLELRQNLENLNKLNYYNNNNFNNININENKNMNISFPIDYKKKVNSGNIGVGFENDSFITDDKVNLIRKNNSKNNNFSSNLRNIFEKNNNLNENYENIEKICMNSRRCLNNLMNNAEKMEKAFLNDNEFLKLPSKSKNNNINYLNSLNQHRLCHKYI